MKFKYALTIVCLFAISALASAYAQDNWLGGTGNWSNGTFWSLGFPPPPSDNATIYSGGADLVTLDVGSVTINTLTLGGVNQLDISELTAGGAARSLTVLNGLNVGLTGYLAFRDSSSIVNLGGSSTNTGYLAFGGTLNNNGILTNYGVGRLEGGILNNNYTFIDTSGGANINLETLNNNHYMETDSFMQGPDTLNNNYGALLNNNGEWWTYVVNNNYRATFNNNALVISFDTLNNNYGATWNNNYGSRILIESVGGGLNNSGILNNNGGIYALSDSTSINNYYGGTLNNNLGASIAVVTLNNNYGATLNNMGSLTLSGYIGHSGTLENSGTLDVPSYNTLNNHGTISNSGTLINDGLYMQSAGSTVVDGLLSSSTPIQINGGRLSGNGLIQGDVVMGGTMSPGDSPGVLTMQGNYTQLPGGTFLAEIAGLAPGTQYDQLLVSGTAALDGTLDVDLLNGFLVQVGDSFVLMTFGSESGQFSMLDLPTLPRYEQWLLSYNANDLLLSVEAKPTPEPSSFLLLGSSVLGALGAFRRKSNL